MSTLDLIEAERLRTADFLEGLDAAALATQSLCGKWTVQQVGAHLLMPLLTPLPKFALAMVRAGGSFDRANDRLSRQLAERGVAEIAAGLRSRARSGFHAPGFPLEASLTDLLVHGRTCAGHSV